MRLQRNTKIWPKTWAISNTISKNKKATMPTNIVRKEKTSSILGNFYINDWKNREKRIAIGTLYSISCHVQRLN